MDNRIPHGERNRLVRGVLPIPVALSELPWRLIPEESRSGAMNMALDEAAGRAVGRGADPVLRLYRWQPSTLSLGYNQDPATIDWTACRSRGVSVTRRPTGGGAIYHDRWGDISYSIVIPAQVVSGDLLESYHTLCSPLLDAFERMGVAAEFSEDERPGVWPPACYLRPIHPAHDIVVDGRKISGNAQYRQRSVVVQHGSITFESDPTRHLAVFDGLGATREAFEERVTDVRSDGGISRQEAVSILETALREWGGATTGSWSGEELRQARRLAESKYRSPPWVRSGIDPTD